MLVLGAGKRWTLSALLDFFIPREMLVDAGQHRRARMFMLSHAFGPILGSSLPIYMYVMNIARDYRIAVFLFSILAFWIYPILLRSTGRYRLLAFASIQNLAFCVVWACYSFGGLHSPFLPWMLIVPLLAFLYLPPVGHDRNILLLQIFGSLAFLLWLGLGPQGLLPDVNFGDLQVIGMISMASVAIYFMMMSLYFAKMFREQREFERELNGLITSSGNLEDLTAAARQAGAAKAGFIAGMSHELRTPLNAIIGYSQLLLEETEEEGDEESLADLKQVHSSGLQLLHLIDHILDYSRIEAGKMPINPTLGSLVGVLPKIRADIQAVAPDLQVELLSGNAETTSVLADWTAFSAIIRNIGLSTAEKYPQGRLEIALVQIDEEFELRLQQFDASGTSQPIRLGSYLFIDEWDLSPTKYGSTGIELALAHKYIQLVGGETYDLNLPKGGSTTAIRFGHLRPELHRNQALAA